MVANLLLGSALYYSGLLVSNPPWTILSAWEAALVAIVTVYGMIKCYDAAGGDLNPRFAAQFACLSFPIWLWTSVIAWSAYWLFRLSFPRWASVVISEDHSAIQASYLANTLSWYVTMAVIVGSQIAYFTWMRGSLRRAATSDLG